MYQYARVDTALSITSTAAYIIRSIIPVFCVLTPCLIVLPVQLGSGVHKPTPICPFEKILRPKRCPKRRNIAKSGFLRTSMESHMLQLAALLANCPSKCNALPTTSSKSRKNPLKAMFGLMAFKLVLQRRRNTSFVNTEECSVSVPQNETVANVCDRCSHFCLFSIII